MAQVMTVLGSISPEELRFTLMHEHLIVDLFQEHFVDALLNDEELAIKELMFFKRAGGCSLVEVTTSDMGRDPLALKRVSEATGVNIIMGSGWYRQRYFPERIDVRGASELAEEIVQDITEGADGTGIKAGIIGEIGTDHAPYMSAQEERVLRAAGRAQKRTDVAITLHTTFNPKLALNQMDVLEEEGVDLRRVIVGHCDLYLSLDYHERVAKRGAYVQYDTFGRVNVYPDEQRVAMLAEMLKRGYVSQLLLSSDVTRRSNLHSYKGYGYDYVPVKIIPALKKAGVSDEEIHIMTAENPKRVLAF